MVEVGCSACVKAGRSSEAEAASEKAAPPRRRILGEGLRYGYGEVDEAVGEVVREGECYDLKRRKTGCSLHRVRELGELARSRDDVQEFRTSGGKAATASECLTVQVRTGCVHTVYTGILFSSVAIDDVEGVEMPMPRGHTWTFEIVPVSNIFKSLVQNLNYFKILSRIVLSVRFVTSYL